MKKVRQTRRMKSYNIEGEKKRPGGLKLVTKIRDSKGMAPSEFARYTKILPHLLHYYENQAKNCSLDYLCRLAKIVGWPTLNKLIEEEVGEK